MLIQQIGHFHPGQVPLHFCCVMFSCRKLNCWYIRFAKWPTAAAAKGWVPSHKYNHQWVCSIFLMTCTQEGSWEVRLESPRLTCGDKLTTHLEEWGAGKGQVHIQCRSMSRCLTVRPNNMFEHVRITQATKHKWQEVACFHFCRVNREGMCSCCLQCYTLVSECWHYKILLPLAKAAASSTDVKLPKRPRQWLTSFTNPVWLILHNQKDDDYHQK